MKDCWILVNTSTSSITSGSRRHSGSTVEPLSRAAVLFTCIKLSSLTDSTLNMPQLLNDYRKENRLEFSDLQQFRTNQLEVSWKHMKEVGRSRSFRRSSWGTRGIPRPDEVNNLSREFWFCPESPLTWSCPSSLQRKLIVASWIHDPWAGT